MLLKFFIKVILLFFKLLKYNIMISIIYIRRRI